ncbi:hypothetical protein ABGV49_08860 [Chromobacterium vaccinii]|uniref:Uncharacterized protein n=1 Tax=Chromobacterium vaccinii TaxID=1108595 RepID=A0ABV0FAP7_9NEIS
MARRENVSRVSVEVDYISACDQTISGSRNGHTPLLLWTALKSRRLADWRQRAERCVKLAQHAVDRLQAEGIPAWRNPNSITVVFPCPADWVCEKHGLAKSGGIAHLIAMPHHRDGRQIDELIDDIAMGSQAYGRASAAKPELVV